MPSDTERAVLAANAAFYEAFAQRDAARMDAVWARHTPVTCIHPGHDLLAGRDAVMASWHGILESPGAPPISCAKPVVYLYGETASVVCLERLPGGPLIATNVFVLEDGAWRMVHHHAGPVAGGAEADPGPPPPDRTLH